MQHETNIVTQLEILREKFRTTPEKLSTGKWNPAYFALKGKIAIVEKKVAALRRFQYLAQ